VAKAWQLYQPKTKRDNDSWRSDRSYSTHLVRLLGPVDCSALTLETVDSYRNQRGAELTRRGAHPSRATLDREIGEKDVVLATPREPYTRALVSAVPRADRKLRRFELVDDTQSARVSLNWSRIDRQEEIGDGPVVALDGVSLTYRQRGLAGGQVEAVRGVDLAIA